jgi:hypothetical protein
MSDKFEVGKCYIRNTGTIVIRIESIDFNGHVEAIIVGHWRDPPSIRNVDLPMTPGRWKTSKGFEHMYTEISEEEAMIYILAQ